MRKLETIDFFKLIFSICVVCIHTGFLSFLPPDIAWFINRLIFRIAVPFFFVVNGFFLYKRVCDFQKKAERNLIEYNKKMLKTYAIYTLIYSFLYLLKEILLHRNLNNSILELLHYLIVYPIGAMWYVWALILSVCIIIIINKFTEINRILYKLFLITFVFYCVGLLFNSYYFIIENTPFQNIADIYISVFLTSRNAIFVGLPFIFLGMVMRKIIDNGFYMNKGKIIILLIFSYILFFIELVLIYKKTYVDDKSMFLSFYLIIPLILIFACETNMKFIDKYDLRALSSFVYYNHMIYVMFYSLVLNDGVLKTLAVLITCIFAYLFKIKLVNNVYKLCGKVIN